MVTATRTVYVVLPQHENDVVGIFTGIDYSAPPVHRDDITPAALEAIDAAQIAEPDALHCAQCGTAVGYHFDGSTDPETFHNTGFFVASDGAVRCEECSPGA